MSARHAPFRQIDVARFIRGLKQGGIDVDRCEVDPRTGNIVAFAKSPDKPPGESALDQWMTQQERNETPS